MTEPICGNCKWWNPPEAHRVIWVIGESNSEYGECLLTATGDAAEHTDYESRYDLDAYAQDHEDFSAILRTKENHYCSEHQWIEGGEVASRDER